MSDTKYAGFWMRFAAFIIDYIVIQLTQSFLIIPILAVFGLGFAAFDFNQLTDLAEEDIFVLLTSIISMVSSIALLSFLINLLYYSLMESSKHQATLGKMAVGIIVTDTNGERLDFTKAMIRSLGKIISSFIFMIGYIMAAFTEKKQALHDMIAGTYVVQK
ncbi:MAG: RDD family protein [Cyclobacteriaceae bacterium]|nr:RDD family protein [Cyclobacteriaceae bacterium]